jgi:DNA-3-methyladenine glycosylase
MPQTLGFPMEREFYLRDPSEVAKDLLGKHLVRKWKRGSLEGMIVETEAYYGSEDPASRAYNGKKNYNQMMWGDPGRVFIYNVHRYWMFNIVSHLPNEVGAVLLRAIIPTNGVNMMLENRQVEKLQQLTSGPGKLTLALGIDKMLQGADVTNPKGEIFIAWAKPSTHIKSSRRIGVKRDLERDLRFYINGNMFVSR